MIGRCLVSYYLTGWDERESDLTVTLPSDGWQNDYQLLGWAKLNVDSGYWWQQPIRGFTAQVGWLCLRVSRHLMLFYIHQMKPGEHAMTSSWWQLSTSIIINVCFLCYYHSNANNRYEWTTYSLTVCENNGGKSSSSCRTWRFSATAPTTFTWNGGTTSLSCNYANNIQQAIFNQLALLLLLIIIIIYYYSKNLAATLQWTTEYFRPLYSAYIRFIHSYIC